MNRIKAVVNDIALQSGFHNLDIALVEGEKIGCLDVYLLKISQGKSMTSALVFQNDFDDIMNGTPAVRLESRIRSALERLRVME